MTSYLPSEFFPSQSARKGQFPGTQPTLPLSRHDQSARTNLPVLNLTTTDNAAAAAAVDLSCHNRSAKQVRTISQYSTPSLSCQNQPAKANFTVLNRAFPVTISPQRGQPPGTRSHCLSHHNQPARANLPVLNLTAAAAAVAFPVTISPQRPTSRYSTRLSRHNQLTTPR